MAHQINSSRDTPMNMSTCIFLCTIYAPSMLYALPAFAANEEELGKIQTNMMATALQKLGAAKTTPTAIRHGPIELGGMNIIDLRTKPGISNLKNFRQAIYSGSNAGKLLLIRMKYTQIEAGISLHILEHPEVALPYITSTWITSLCQFMYQHNVTAKLSSNSV
jgi:hypothetical protein